MWLAQWYDLERITPKDISKLTWPTSWFAIAVVSRATLNMNLRFSKFSCLAYLEVFNKDFPP